MLFKTHLMVVVDDKMSFKYVVFFYLTHHDFKRCRQMSRWFYWKIL